MVALFFVALFFVAPRVSAQAPSLTAEFRVGVRPTPRPGAPIPVEIELDYRGADVVKGRVEFERGSAFRGYRSAPLTLRPGVQTYRFLVPGIEPPVRWFSGCSSRVTFLPEDGSLVLLGRVTLSGPTSSRRSIATAFVHADGATDSYAWRLPLQLDQYPLEGTDPPETVFDTQTHRLAASELPASPLSLCAYDMMVIDGAGFLELEAPRLLAIERWLRAGGAVALVVRDGLGSEHEEFLDRCLGGAPTIPVTVAKVDLGRLVVARDDVPFETDDAWRRSGLFLARVSDADLQLIASQRSFAWRADSRVITPTLDLNQNHVYSVLGLESVDVMPLSVVLALLALIVVVVGPVDRLALGWLRRHTLTWVTVPLACACFTVGAIWLSGSYIGSVDTGSLTIVDIGEGGRILRQSRLDLHFPTRHGEREDLVEEALLTRIRFGGGDREVSDADRTVGSFPGRYARYFNESKWSPYLTREFRIGGTINVPVPALELPSSSSRRPVSDQPARLEPALEAWARDFDNVELFSIRKNSVRRAQMKSDSLPEADFLFPLTSFSRRHETGVIREAISPSGSFRLDDLPIATHDEFILGVIAKKGNSVYFFRRRFELNP